MIRQRQYETIHELYATGHSKAAIASLLGIDRKTVRSYLAKQSWQEYQRRAHVVSLLHPFHEWIKGRVAEVDYNASILFRELKSQGYEGSYETVKAYVAPLRVHKPKGCVRFETEPGMQAQVDWGSAWVWMNQTQVKVHFFAMVLGYSRRLFAQGYLNEKLTTLIQAHESAFDYFGGRPQEILYDNPKTMVMSHDPKTRQVLFNAQFKDFTDYYGFEPRFCQPYRAQTKGKIESGVKYIKRNFVPGRRFEDLTHLNTELLYWMANVADKRIHGTTHERPIERFEREELIPLQHCVPYQCVAKVARKVAQDSFISFQSNRYSVPWQHVGDDVDLCVREGQLEIFAGDVLIAKHLLLTGKHELSLNKDHYNGLIRGTQKPLHHRPPQHDLRWRYPSFDTHRDLKEYDVLLTQTHTKAGVTC